MNDKPVSSTPIHEMCDTMLNPAYFPAFQRYLENICECTCIALHDKHVIVHFPEGTMEEEYAETATAWRRETTIRLPNRVRLLKRVYFPMREGERTLIALVLPNDAMKKETKTWRSIF